MSASNDSLNNLRKNIEDLIKKGREAEDQIEETGESVKRTARVLDAAIDQLENGLDSIAKKTKVARSTVEDVADAFIKLKVVPDALSAITKYQDILTKGVKDYRSAVNDGYDSAVQFLNANKKEYSEASANAKKVVQEYEKRIAAGEKLTQKEQKKLSLARQEAVELVPLIDKYRQERKEMDATAKAKDRDAAASQKKGKATKDAADKGTKATKEEVKVSKELSQSLQKVLEDVTRIRAAINTGGGLKVQINNAGFTRVLDEMANAIDRFHERAEGSTPRKKNFFDQVLGTREENKKSGDEVVKEAKQTINQIGSNFIDPLSNNLTEKISKAVSKGIKNGIIEGTIEASHSNPANTELVNLADRMGLSKAQRQRLLTNMMDKKDLTAIEQTQILETRKLKQHQYDTRNANKAKVDMYKANLDFELRVNPDAVNERIEAKARYENTKAMREEAKMQRELEKAKRDEYNRQINAKEKVRVEKELANVYGEEGSKIRKLGEDLVLLQAKRREYMIQGDELNKINFAELANNTRKIQETARKWADEMYRVRNKTQETSQLIKSMQNVYTRIASMTQTASAAISAASGIFSTMRTASTSFFRYFTNGFRRAFAYVRTLASSTLNAGIEQRKKIEQAQIGFASFFGEDNVEAVTAKIRTEAAKTPIVDAGALAEYVQQLAPVSKGNANTAINASLGILKALVYSGSDISEGEYVIKNIRDVIAKGKGTAIDIRQFNRALPGLETALKKAGLTEFLNKEGQLTINKKNVGKVLDLFATLNTSETSPLKDIEEKQLKTLNGLQELFTEKKTTAMETILAKSGFFDLMYDVLGIANDDGKWQTISNTLGNVLKPLVKKISDFINGVDWRDLSYKITSFFKVVWSGITEAKNILSISLKNAFGTNTEKVFTRLAELIRNFIVGFAEGTSDVIDFVSNLVKKISGGNLERFVEMIGKYLVSPLGKLIQMMLGLAQNGVGALSRVFANISSMYKGLGDLWNWAVNQKSAKFSNRIVSNMKISDMTAAQLQQAIKGQPITANGQPAAAAASGATSVAGMAGVAALNAESTKGAGVMSWFKDKATSAGLAVARFAIKLTSAAIAGGSIYLFTRGLSDVIRTLNQDNKALQTTADVLETLGTALAGGVAGGMLGGVTGGLIGAAIGAAAALVKLSIAAREAAEQETKKKVEEIQDKQRQAIYDGIMAALKAQGVNTDTGTDEGWYADQKLKQYLNSTDPESIDWTRAANIFAEALRFKNTAEQIKDYTTTEEFSKAGGVKMNFNNKTDLRDKLAEMVRWFRLNGDSYDYDGSSDETLLNDYTGGKGITDKQAQLLIDRWGELDITEAENTTELSKNITALDNNSDMTDQAREAIENAKDSVDGLREKIDEVYEDYKKQFMDPGNPIGSFFNTIISLFSGNFNSNAMGLTHNAEIDVNGEKKTATIDDVKEAIKRKSSEMANQIKKETDPAKKKELQEELAKILVASRFSNEDFYKNNSADFIKNYINDLPWLIEYLRKILENKFAGGFITPIHRATGGALGVDTVPAMLQPGEFIMRKAAVDKIGLSTLFGINRGDLAYAARSLGSRFGNSFNNSRNWNNVVNNNQKTQSNYIRIFNKNKSGRVNTYYGLANRIALS